MPRIWIDYCQFLVDQCKVTRSRRTFDRALRALPITQHRRIWPIYLKFVRKYHIPETAVRVYRRYLKVSADFNNYWTRLSKILHDMSVESRTIICQRLRQIIDLRDNDKSWYFAITEFNIHILHVITSWQLREVICHFSLKNVVPVMWKR